MGRVVGRIAAVEPPLPLALLGGIAWILGGFLAFYDHSDGTAAAFVGAGLVLFLVAAYFDRIEEAGPGGIKVGPVGPDGTDSALAPTPDEADAEPPPGILPPAAETPRASENGVEIFENLSDVPVPTLGALFSQVTELREAPDLRFYRALRKQGRGNNPWVFEFRQGPEIRAWRVAWGGRGKRSATVDKHSR